MPFLLMSYPWWQRGLTLGEELMWWPKPCRVEDRVSVLGAHNAEYVYGAEDWQQKCHCSGEEQHSLLPNSQEENSSVMKLWLQLPCQSHQQRPNCWKEGRNLTLLNHLDWPWDRDKGDCLKNWTWVAWHHGPQNWQILPNVTLDGIPWCLFTWTGQTGLYPLDQTHNQSNRWYSFQGMI